MLSEEEIIKYIKNIKPKNFNNYKDETPCCLITKKQIKVIENLLDLYQKEKAKNKKYQGIEDGTTIIYKSKAKYVREDRIEKYYIDKNKIREKIKELVNRNVEVLGADRYEYAVKVLQELLEEE